MKESRMDLILWRHAEAELLQPGQSDLERALTSKGERQARRMAAWLNARLAESTRIIVSPALRTQQTAAALERKFKTVASFAPGRSVDELLVGAGWPGASLPVLVVGHQPTLGRAAALLLTGEAADWSVRKGALWWFTRRPRNGAEETVLRAVMAPDLV